MPHETPTHPLALALKGGDEPALAVAGEPVGLPRRALALAELDLNLALACGAGRVRGLSCARCSISERAGQPERTAGAARAPDRAVTAPVLPPGWTETSSRRGPGRTWHPAVASPAARTRTSRPPRLIFGPALETCAGCGCREEAAVVGKRSRCNPKLLQRVGGLRAPPQPLGKGAQARASRPSSWQPPRQEEGPSNSAECRFAGGSWGLASKAPSPAGMAARKLCAAKKH